jgi:hypothetical protein
MKYASLETEKIKMNTSLYKERRVPTIQILRNKYYLVKGVGLKRKSYVNEKRFVGFWQEFGEYLTYSRYYSKEEVTTIFNYLEKLFPKIKWDAFRELIFPKIKTGIGSGNTYPQGIHGRNMLIFLNNLCKYYRTIALMSHGMHRSHLLKFYAYLNVYRKQTKALNHKGKNLVEILNVDKRLARLIVKNKLTHTFLNAISELRKPIALGGWDRDKSFDIYALKHKNTWDYIEKAINNNVHTKAIYMYLREFILIALHKEMVNNTTYENFKLPSPIGIKLTNKLLTT